jgi:hypothetical protein
MDRFKVMRSVVKRIPPAIIGIGVLLCLDAALIAFGWIATSEVPLGVNPVAEESWTPPDLDAPPPSEEHARRPEQNDPVLARPIFFPSRKPIEPPPQAAAPAVPKTRPPDPTFVVDGIMLTSRASRVHLRRLQEVDGRWHETGRVIDGWKIKRIDATGIELEQGEWTFAIHLYSSDSRAYRIVRQSPHGAAQ